MSLIPLTRPGTWTLSSQTNPEWDSSGHSQCGGFMIPPECKAKIKLLEEKLGQQPIDLTFEYMKD